MSEIICRSISNGREFEVMNDYFNSLHALRSECNSYIPAEARYTELLAEHDKQIKADLLDKVMQKQRTIIDDDGVMYKAVLLKDIEDLKAEVSK